MVQPAHTGLCVGDDSGERLVHFVGNGRRQFAQRGHAGYMCEFRLRAAQRLFGVICADRRRNIGAGAPIAQEVAVSVKERLAA